MIAADYANARVKGMRSRLLGAGGVRELLVQGDPEAQVEWLRRTVYGEAIAAEQSANAPRGLAVARALRSHMAEDIERIHRSLFDSARLVFDAMMSPLDAYDLKTILRAAGKGSRAEHVVSLLVRTPLFGERALAELTARGDARSLHRLLESWQSPFAAPLGEMLAARPGGDASLLALETALDRFAFARALEAAHRRRDDGDVCVAIVEMQIDLTNTALLLKEAHDGDALRLFVPGGKRLDAKTARRLVVLEGPELATALSRLLGVRELASLRAVYARPHLLDQLLQRALASTTARLARMHPLSLAVPLAFVFERVMEARAVRLVLAGTEAGAPADDLLELVEGSPR